MTPRALVALALASAGAATASCGGSGGQAAYPRLSDGDTPDSSAARPHADETKGPVAEPGEVLFPPEGAACMPPGVYDVAFDLAPATLTVEGQSDEFCRSMLAAVPQTQLAEMKLAIEAGQLAVYWPGRQHVLVHDPCSFEIKAPPVAATLTFVAGAGRGTGSYAVGSENHPGETCAATGVRITLVRASS